MEFFFNAMADFFAVVDKDYSIVQINKALADRLGLPAAAAQGRKCYDLLHGAAEPPAFCPHAGLLADGQPRSLCFPDENLRGHFEAALVPWRGEDGALLGTIHVIKDKTDHRQAELALAAAESRFRLLVQNIEAVFRLASSDGQKLLYVSPAYEAIWGRPVQSAYERPLAWLEAVHPEDRPGLAAAAQGRLGGGALTQESFEYRIIRPDDQVRWIRERVFPILDAAGASWCLAGLAVDVTELKEAQEKLRQANHELEAGVRDKTADLKKVVADLRLELRERLRTEAALWEGRGTLQAILDATPESILLLTRDLTVRALNKAAAQRFGGSVSDLVGREIKSLLPEDLYGAHRAKVEQLLQTGQPLRFEARHDGRIVTHRLFPVFGSTGQITQVSIYSQDVTEHRLIEEELRRHRNRLAGLVQERTQSLETANAQLRREMEARKSAEAGLREKDVLLEAKTQALEEMNTTLRVLLRQRQEDQHEVDERVWHNITRLIKPLLDKLAQSNLTKVQRGWAESISHRLEELTSSLGVNLASHLQPLTPREREICFFLLEGKSTKEISDRLGLSARSVETHRANIRRKLGLRNKRLNLIQHLRDLAEYKSQY